ncbi:MAG: hypothetical protein Ct9H300mP12_05450 [Acidimicrobiales bacterium]|nr:MAG: hypothetical protein Ct9H300mP12_05450 [Acidimicrobiales bacterium]
MDHYHRELGRIVWEYIGMGRTEAGLTQALSEIPALRDEFPLQRPSPGQR